MNIKQIKDTLNNPDFTISYSLDYAPMFFDYNTKKNISSDEMKEVILSFFDDYYSALKDDEIVDEDTLQDNINEFCESSVNPYHYCKLQWLATDTEKVGFIDEVVQQFGIDNKDFDFLKLLGMAMCYANEQAFNQIMADIKEFINDNKE